MAKASFTIPKPSPETSKYLQELTAEDLKRLEEQAGHDRKKLMELSVADAKARGIDLPVTEITVDGVDEADFQENAADFCICAGAGGGAFDPGGWCACVGVGGGVGSGQVQVCSCVLYGHGT